MLTKKQYRARAKAWQMCAQYLRRSAIRGSFNNKIEREQAEQIAAYCHDISQDCMKEAENKHRPK